LAVDSKAERLELTADERRGRELEQTKLRQQKLRARQRELPLPDPPRNVTGSEPTDALVTPSAP